MVPGVRQSEKEHLLPPVHKTQEAASVQPGDVQTPHMFMPIRKGKERRVMELDKSSLQPFLV